MTVIVGLEYDGSVLMGGDIQGTGWNNKVIHTQPKVFKKNGVMFGFTSSYRFGQVLEHELPDPVVPEDPTQVYRWLITVLVPNIHAALKSADADKCGNALIGLKGQLWELQTDYSVLRSTRGFAAVGSGAEYAMGSVFTSLLDKPKTFSAHEEIIRNAIIAAGTFSPSVGTDSYILAV